VSGGAAAALPEMLGRLKLNAIRDRLDGLLDEAARRDLTLPKTLVLLCEAEVAHREERRVRMGLGIAKFPYMRTLEGFDFSAQPSLDPKQVRDLTTKASQGPRSLPLGGQRRHAADPRAAWGRQAASRRGARA